MANWHKIEAADGTIVPIQCNMARSKAKAHLLFLPALGVKARFYRHLAAALADEGISIYLFEQRGHGESPYRAGRGQKFGYREYLNVDLPAAIDFVLEQSGDLPFFIGGHSLGGHMASIIAGRMGEQVNGLLHLACGFPYAGFYPGKVGAGVRIIAQLVPVITALLGYFPGEKLGFGGREYRQLMMDWRCWALKGGYDFPSVSGVEDVIASYTGPALSIGFEKDTYISDDALAYSRSCLSGAQLEEIMLGREEQGTYLGHFEWAKAPAGVVSKIVSWMQNI